MNTKALRNQSNHSVSNPQKLTKLLNRWKRNISTRHKLLEMDDDRLADIGVDRKTAIIESRKPFWR